MNRKKGSLVWLVNKKRERVIQGMKELQNKVNWHMFVIYKGNTAPCYTQLESFLVSPMCIKRERFTVILHASTHWHLYIFLIKCRCFISPGTWY